MAGDERADELRTLRDIARWTRELALPLIRERVTRLLDTDAKKRVYASLESGDASVLTIERVTGANHSDISQWIKLWQAEGIVEKDAGPGRATFTLTELGIVPAPPKASRKTGSM